MDNDRYKELFSNAERWMDEACRQLFAAQVLFSPAFLALRSFERMGSASMDAMSLAAEKVKSLSNARAFHLGIAIENATKARKIINGEITVFEGKPRGLRTDHNILEHVRQCGVQLTDKEEKFLERLSFQVSSLAKYPIAKDLESQRKFTGIIVGSHPEEEPMVMTIIAKVIQDTGLESMFPGPLLASNNPVQLTSDAPAD
ncbi:hypothetical protein [Alloalcanivorax venustensis]|uniref:hypothetical protein n=1 Tax=Alloalcanivorax venustensis TaxID=172371 RepID=UPI0039E2CA03